MAQRYGPKVVTNNLVLCLDAHDAKSYAGEPVTNMAYNEPVLGQGSTWEAITSIPQEGSDINFSKLNTRSTANSFLNSNGKIFRNYVNNPAPSDDTAYNNNGGFRCATAIDFTSGSDTGYIIISFWCYLVTGYTGFSLSGLGSSYMKFNDSGGSDLGNGSISRFVDGVAKTAPETFNADTGRWKFVQLRFTKLPNSTAIRNFYIYADRNTQGEMYVCQLQIEDRSDSGFYRIPYTENVRSATDGWKDRTSNGNDGTLTNMVGTGVDHYRNGEIIMPIANSYLDFDGTDDQVIIPSLGSSYSNYSLEFWIAQNGTPSSSRFYSWNAGGTFTVRYNSSPQYFQFHYNPLDGSPSTTSVNGNSLSDTVNGIWHHVVVTNNSSVGAIVYTDGVAGATGEAAVALNNGHILGTGLTGINPTNCKIAKFNIYNTDLTAAEVLSNYNVMKKRFGL